MIKRYWLISDTHFNHLKLEEWGTRSGNWQNRLWKSMESLGSDDVLIHLGDICIGNDAEIHDRIRDLCCKTILIKGNHDNKSAQWYMDHGWDFVCDGLELLFEGHYLHLTHRPARPQGNTTWNIHGHTHGQQHHEEEFWSFHDLKYHIDISPEIVGFEAISLSSLMKKKK